MVYERTSDCNWRLAVTCDDSAWPMSPIKYVTQYTCSFPFYCCSLVTVTQRLLFQPFTEAEFSAWKKAMQKAGSGSIPTMKKIAKEHLRIKRKEKVREKFVFLVRQCRDGSRLMISIFFQYFFSRNTRITRTQNKIMRTSAEFGSNGKDSRQRILRLVLDLFSCHWRLCASQSLWICHLLWVGQARRIEGTCRELERLVELRVEGEVLWLNFTVGVFRLGSSWTGTQSGRWRQSGDTGQGNCFTASWCWTCAKGAARQRQWCSHNQPKGMLAELRGEV